MPWNRTDPEKERMAFVVEHQRRMRSMTALCRAYGVSRRTGYRWVGRVAVEGPAGCKDRSRAPRHHPHAVPERIRRVMVETRLAHPTWGPRKILAFWQQREPGDNWPAASTVGAILAQEGLVLPRRRRRASSPYGQPFQTCRGPNDVWCADFKRWFRTGDGVRCVYHRLEGTWEVRFGPVVLGSFQEQDPVPRLRRPKPPGLARG